MTAGAAPVRAELRVDGVVQGVGFRPFVYRTAVAHDLAGWVRNLGDAGVRIVVEGDEDDVDGFLTALRTEAPPLSRVETVDVDRCEPEDLGAFSIRESTDATGGSGTIPPDTGICDQCLADMRDADSRYHRYWATACVDCGPRYTVIRDLPYDRPTTTMDEFPLCDACRDEYEDPADRRYHAQAIACPDCGPSLSLIDVPTTHAQTDGSQANTEAQTVATGEEAVRVVADRLDSGAVTAVKGIGGAHLVCDATDPAVVDRLRTRTGRPAKPFAVMAPDIESVEGFATVSERERQALQTVRRPIVIVERGDGPWLDAVAPGLHTVGVMLPYAGLHHLLFDGIDRPLVMTSANLPGQPMCTTTAEIRERLAPVVEWALVHDRAIAMGCDDTVARVVDGDRRFVRRSRGWVPEPLPRPGGSSRADDDPRPAVLALGPEFDVTVAVTQGETIVPSHYVGDVDNPDTLAYLDDTVEHLLALTGTEPGLVACDRHPGFLTSERAAAFAGGDQASNGVAFEQDDWIDSVTDIVRVQHHHAHAASLLGEHGRERALVVAADGTGYGRDGTIWGGEVLDATRADFERVAGLDTFLLPGGEAAIERPARILASLLGDAQRIDDLLVERGAVTDRSGAATVRRQVERGVNAPATTSTGRVLDAVSALLDVCRHRHYEGEPAMRLEAAAAAGSPLDVEVPETSRDDRRVLDVHALLRDLADRFLNGHASRATLAATAQQALATGLADLAVGAAADRGVDAVGFTGGVAYNEAMTRAIRERVEAAGLRFLGHDRVPPGDGGVAYGQVVVADAR